MRSIADRLDDDDDSAVAATLVGSAVLHRRGGDSARRRPCDVDGVGDVDRPVAPRRSIIRVASLLELLPLSRDDDDVPKGRGGDEGGDTDRPRAPSFIPVVHLAPVVVLALYLLFAAPAALTDEEVPLMLLELLLAVS